MTDDTAPNLREICEILDSAVGERRGFAFFLQESTDVWRYASSAHRGDVVDLLQDWLERLATSLEPPGTPRTPERDSIEALCAEIGLVISLTGTHVLLFLFEQNDQRSPGDVAFFTNAPRAARPVVERWLQREAARAAAAPAPD